jgi:predicted phosphodiesterase
MERLNEIGFIASKEGIRDVRTPEYIIFREQKHAPKAPELPLERPKLEIPINESSAPDELFIGEKKKPSIKDSRLWEMNFSKRELKKEIQGQLCDLEADQQRLDKEKVNPYWEYSFSKVKQDLIGLGDFHYGARTCDVAKIKDKVKAIKKTGAAVILMGDLIENANKYSVGAGVYEQTITPMQQMADVMKLIEPIKDQVMVMIDGNHEFRTWKECGFKPTQIMAEKLGIPYAGFEAFVRMKVKKFTYVVYATHGSTSARFAWTRMKSLEDIMRTVDADIVLEGHTHDKLYHEVRYKGIAEKKKIGVLTGSFLKDDPHGYAAMKNLPPVKTGMVVLELSGNHWDCHGKD